MKKLFLLLLLIGETGQAAITRTSVENLKMQKRFGMGLSVGGPLATLGFEIDMNFMPEFSISGGVGTGLDYSTFMVKARYFLPGEWVSPYFAAGFARWWSNGTRETDLSPAVLKKTFLGGQSSYERGFSVFLVYPAIGVQVMHSTGLSFFAEAQYLFQLMNFANGTYAGCGVHWYF